MTGNDLSTVPMLRQAGRIGEAEQFCRNRLASVPGDHEALYQLGLTMIERARRTLSAPSAIAPALSDLAGDLLLAGAAEHAIEIYRAVITLDADHAMAHMGLGMGLLSLGRFGEGWPEYEWHRRLPGAAPVRFAAPLWNGKYRPGLRILLHAEQGFGDALQFVRYAAPLKAGGAQVILGCAPALKRLLARVAGVDAVIGHGEAIPPHDCHLPLLSLPGLMKTELNSIPAPLGYISAAPADIEARRGQLERLARPLVGLIWQGNRQNKVLQDRSIPLPQWLPILRQKGAHFISLQPDGGVAGLANVAVKQRPFDPFAGGPPRDFADTAALMANLDLVIAIDTAGAHLAGAMGLPAWTLLTHAPDWRWLRGRDDSPWYSTMRLFRQHHAGDWDEVVGRVALALEDWLHARQ